MFEADPKFAYMEGYEAAKVNVRLVDCPFDTWSDPYYQWYAGWVARKDEAYE